MLDPSPVPVRKPPRDADSWITAAAGSWVVALDNLSAVSEWLSDTLCRASTGDGDVKRQLYTDGGLVVFAFRRCVLLNVADADRPVLAAWLVSVLVPEIPHPIPALLGEQGTGKPPRLASWRGCWTRRPCRCGNPRGTPNRG